MLLLDWPLQSLILNLIVRSQKHKEQKYDLMKRYVVASEVSNKFVRDITKCKESKQAIHDILQNVDAIPSIPPKEVSTLIASVQLFFVFFKSTVILNFTV